MSQPTSQPMSQPLSGKTALVTGGSRGIGRSIATRLAREGATVALTYNASRRGAEETVAAVERSGGSAFALHADLVDAKSIPELFEQADREFLRRTGSDALDLLINNAGNAGWGGLMDATPDSWDEMFAVHARAPFFLVQSALSRLADGGRVVNISSALPPPAARASMPAPPASRRPGPTGVLGSAGRATPEGPGSGTA